MSSISSQSSQFEYEFQRILAWEKKHNPWQFSKEALAPTPTKSSITKRSLTALNRLAQPQQSPGLQYQALVLTAEQKRVKMANI